MLSGWLLQILKKPRSFDPNSKNLLERVKDNPFAFGGGGSGLSEEAKDIVYKLWDFEYMGSAEYEFGALPKALERIVKKPKLISYERLVTAKEIKGNDWKRKPWAPRGSKPKKTNLPPIKDVTVYVICDEGERSQVDEIITKLAKNEQQCKAGARSDYFFDPLVPHEEEIRGWIDVTSPGGFFIFKDKEMWEATKAVFMEEQKA